MIEHVSLVLDLIVISIAFALSLISWRAYKKSHLKSVLFLLLAFVFFTIKKALENAHLIFPNIHLEYLNVAVALVEVGILGLFFVAIVKKGD
ncbi:hypothetical protein PAP_09705 [Palaeococcus pacificus DY20341]|uniref:Uncharacterized protein n=1 Tax=Palaeococcus pacificus DY20341 TaxID=1343739 RepID=A0A075LVU8_9EURY|nr:hypothetical protein [Palaeococcus pacificus]AIF70316.1 hypothetical protein PAP_09705 [Palaeococcus pacificus DY20341]